MSLHVRHIERSKWLPLLAVLVGLCAPLGCTLFPAIGPTQTASAKKSLLPPIQAAPEAIQLEVFLLERPAGDHLLSTSIWKEVDQLGGGLTSDGGTSSSDLRELLRENGFQIGIVSSNPPPSVQKLLGMVSEMPSNSPEFAKLMGNRHYMPPGVEAEIATGVEHDHCEFQVRDKDRQKHFEYDQARCVLRMKAHRLHDGWVRIDFQPEIHHGESIMRHTPNQNEWESRWGQSIDVRHSQKFSIEMNVGERALVTSTANDESTMGDRFFCRSDQGQKKQRVLVVRIVDSGRSQAIASK